MRLGELGREGREALSLTQRVGRRRQRDEGGRGGTEGGRGEEWRVEELLLLLSVSLTQSVCVAIVMANHSGIFLCIQHTNNLSNKSSRNRNFATCDSQGHKKANG